MVGLNVRIWTENGWRGLSRGLWMGGPIDLARTWHRLKTDKGFGVVTAGESGIGRSPSGEP